MPYSQDGALVSASDMPRIRLNFPSDEKEITRAMAKCAVLSDVPALSLPNLLGHVVVDRVMIKEARIRRQVCYHINMIMTERITFSFLVHSV